MRNAYEIVDFRPEYQVAAAQLVNAGLGEHFGFVDESMNPDLVDIGEHYTDAIFLIALKGEQLVSTGALTPIDSCIGQIARMHTKSDCRREGIATQMLLELEKRAAKICLQTLILETNIDWNDAIAFYQINGYAELARNETGIRFQKTIS